MIDAEFLDYYLALCAENHYDRPLVVANVLSSSGPLP
jgi:hypothetical protein